MTIKKELYDEKSLIYGTSNLVCTCDVLPTCGNFTLGEMYGFRHRIDAIDLMDNCGQIVTISEKEFDICFSFYLYCNFTNNCLFISQFIYV